MTLCLSYSFRTDLDERILTNECTAVRISNSDKNGALCIILWVVTLYCRGKNCLYLIQQAANEKRAPTKILGMLLPIFHHQYLFVWQAIFLHYNFSFSFFCLTHKCNTQKRQIRYLVTVSKGFSSGTAIFSYCYSLSLSRAVPT